MGYSLYGRLGLKKEDSLDIRCATGHGPFLIILNKCSAGNPMGMFFPISQLPFRMSRFQIFDKVRFCVMGSRVNDANGLCHTKAFGKHKRMHCGLWEELIKSVF